MHVESGIRKILEKPIIYQSFQSLVGADKLYNHFIKNVLCPKHGESILDIGCGPGKILEYIPDGVNYTGIDLNSRYIDKAKEKYNHKGEFICGKLDSGFNFENKNKYDKIFAFALVHHLDDDVLGDIYRQIPSLLVEKGSFYTVDPTYTNKQSTIAKWIISKDRGQNVKSPIGYESMLTNYFTSVETTVLENFINIPYSHCIIKANK